MPKKENAETRACPNKKVLQAVADRRQKTNARKM